MQNVATFCITPYSFRKWYMPLLTLNAITTPRYCFFNIHFYTSDFAGIEFLKPAGILTVTKNILVHAFRKMS